MNENKAVPNIRFKSFENYWVKIKVSNLGNKFTGGGTPSKKNKSYWSGSIPWFQSSDLILNNVLKISIKKRITYKAIDESSTKLVSKDSIAIVTRVGVGKLVLIPYKYTTSQDFISISEIIYNKKFVLYLLYYVLNYSRRLGTKQGTSIKGITKNYFLTTEVVLPKNSFEQQKIGDFFTKLDKLLDLQQQKIDKLELLKKVLLQKLFPRHDAQIPEFRFKGFEGDWRSCDLGKIAKLYQPKTITQKQMTSEGYPVFGANGFIGFYGKKNHSTDQVTISARGENAGVTSYVFAPVWITGNSMVINVDKNADIDKHFLFFDLSLINLKRFATGGAQPQLTGETLRKVKIIVTKINEQQKIGNLLSKVDQLIELENKKLQNFQQVKKCLLQNMFVE